MAELDRSKSFRHNYDQGVPKEKLMKYYCIDTEEKWNKLIEQIKTADKRGKR